MNNTRFLKNINLFFGTVYALILFLIIVFFVLSVLRIQIDISGLTRGLINIAFLGVGEWIVAILVIGAILFSSFVHFRLAKASLTSKMNHVLNIGTALNFVLGLITLYSALTCHQEGCNVVLLELIPMFLIFIFTLISGIWVLKDSKN